MAQLKGHAHQIYINVNLMENVLHVLMILSALASAIVVKTTFVSVETGQGHVTQLLVINAVMELASAAEILNARAI